MKNKVIFVLDDNNRDRKVSVVTLNLHLDLVSAEIRTNYQETFDLHVFYLAIG